MAIQSRFAPFLALIGVLAVGGAASAQAQQTTSAPPRDTSAAARSDTSGYHGYQNRTDSSRAGRATHGADSSNFKYNGPATDTTLKAKAGVQTGPSKMGTRHHHRVVCKDGSNDVKMKGKEACTQHGGIDWASTKAAMKSRGERQHADSAGATADTSSRSRSSADTAQMHKKGAAGYHYTGAPSDTALKAKPGTQTGADTGAMGKSDTSRH